MRRSRSINHTEGRFQASAELLHFFPHPTFWQPSLYSHDAPGSRSAEIFGRQQAARSFNQSTCIYKVKSHPEASQSALSNQRENQDQEPQYRDSSRWRSASSSPLYQIYFSLHVAHRAMKRLMPIDLFCAGM